MSTSDDDILSRMGHRADELTLKTQAMDEAPLGITIADLSQEDEPLVYANAGFETLTGYAAEEAVGRNCRFLQGEDTDPEQVARMRTAIENRESVQVELRNYRKDGTPFWNEVTLAPISEENGRVRYYVGFQQDVTDRKEYARRLEEQRDNLDVLHQLVRHDVRNDLQLVLASVEMLRAHVEDGDREHVDAILDSARHAVDLTDTAREIAEVMLQGEGDRAPVALAPVLEDQLEEITGAHPEASIELEGTIPHVSVLADGMLSSVFRNLLKNALIHNDKPVPVVSVSAATTDGHVIVRVADNGPGIPDDLKEEIFGKGKTFTDEGTGIGLYLVHTLVEAYGGEVWVEDSETDHGTSSEREHVDYADSDLEGAVFVVRLPIAE